MLCKPPVPKVRSCVHHSNTFVCVYNTRGVQRLVPTGPSTYTIVVPSKALQSCQRVTWHKTFPLVLSLSRDGLHPRAPSYTAPSFQSNAHVASFNLRMSSNCKERTAPKEQSTFAQVNQIHQ